MATVRSRISVPSSRPIRHALRHREVHIRAALVDGAETVAMIPTTSSSRTCPASPPQPAGPHLSSEPVREVFPHHGAVAPDREAVPTGPARRSAQLGNGCLVAGIEPHENRRLRDGSERKHHRSSSRGPKSPRHLVRTHALRQSGRTAYRRPVVGHRRPADADDLVAGDTPELVTGQFTSSRSGSTVSSGDTLIRLCVKKTRRPSIIETVNTNTATPRATPAIVRTLCRGRLERCRQASSETSLMRPPGCARPRRRSRAPRRAPAAG